MTGNVSLSIHTGKGAQRIKEMLNEFFRVSVSKRLLLKIANLLWMFSS